MTDNIFEYKNVIHEFLKKHPCDLSVYSYSQIYLWQLFYSFECRMIQNCLCIFAHGEEGVFQFLAPMGDVVSKGVIDECLDYMDNANNGGSVTRIENISEEMVQILKYDSYEMLSRNEEYIYDTNDLIGLKGQRYRSKRSSCSQFEKYENIVFEPYQLDNISECLQVLKSWTHDRKQKYQEMMYSQMLDDNVLIQNRILSDFQEMNLIGYVLKCNSKIVGYTFGYVLNDSVFCVLSEVTDVMYRGSAGYIFRVFCKLDEVSLFPYINVMGDCDVADIRKTKLSYRPSRMVSNYALRRKV